MTTQPLVFIDGDQGTTGLQIHQRLHGRTDLQLLTLPESDRKNPTRRAEAINSCDIAILCLPDAAAREAVAAIHNPAVRVIDASSAHRTAPQWVYGFPEMDAAQAARIAKAQRVSNPGCYPTGAVALLRPLVQAGLLPECRTACTEAALTELVEEYIDGALGEPPPVQGSIIENLIDSPLPIIVSCEWTHEVCGITHSLNGGWVIRGYDRDARSHRFDGNHAVALEMAREKEQSRGIEGCEKGTDVWHVIQNLEVARDVAGSDAGIDQIHESLLVGVTV